MSNYPKSKSELSMIGAETFSLMHGNFSTTTIPCQYKRQHAYVVQQAPVKSTDTVIRFYQPLDKYGGRSSYGIS